MKGSEEREQIIQLLSADIVSSWSLFLNKWYSFILYKVQQPLDFLWLGKWVESA